MILNLSVVLLGFVLLTTTFDVVTSDFPSVRTIRQIHEIGLHDPRNFGEVHNEIFKKVAEKYHHHTRNTAVVNKDEIMDDIKSMLVDLYPNNEAHRQMVNQALEDAKEQVSLDKLKQVPYPENMDDELANLFDQAFDSISQLRSHNLEETLQVLEDLQTKAENLDGTTNPIEQFRAVAALSVARSSTELWHGMKYGHDLHSRTLRELRVWGGDGGTHNRALEDAGDDDDGDTSDEECSNWIINADIIAFFSISVPGTVVAWMVLIPFFLPILLPTLGLASPLVVLFLGPVLLAFASLSVLFSTVGWLLGFLEDECATEEPTMPPSNSTEGFF